MEDIGTGVTNPKVCQLAPGGLFERITFKPIRPGMHNGFYEAYTSEIAAYELDKLLQLGLVLLLWRRASADRSAQLSCGWNRRRASRRWAGSRAYLVRRSHGGPFSSPRP